MTKDIDDLPIDREYWERVMPDSREQFAYSFFKHEHNLNSDLERFGRKKLFRILERKNGSIKLSDGAKAVYYRPISDEDISNYG